MKSTRGGLLFVFSMMIMGMSCFFAGITLAQNAGTGAITGTVTDPSSKAVPDAQIAVTNEATMATINIKSQASGAYTAPLLLPGTYSVEVSKEGFKVWVATGVRVNVTETAALNIKLELGAVTEKVVVSGNAANALQAESSTEGRVTEAETIQNLPLAVRNYTQIIGLNPNVSVGVTNATDLGRGNDPYSAGVSANGVPAGDDNVQMDGVQINDLQQSGAHSGGVAIPNPDTIQEFRVQTSQYDASFGRDAGANVNVETKGGSNQFHGNAWEYFRNSALNANDYFYKRSELLQGKSNTPPVLDQNTFGGDAGGPIIKDKLFFFGSYQGIRQKNGFNSACLSTITGLNGLTNNRTAAGLGAAFDGQSGADGGTILANGSNIAPQALAIMQLAPNGKPQTNLNGPYLIPTPPAGSNGTLTVSNPCPFNEDQFMINADYIQSNKSKFSARFFFANDLTTNTLPTGGAVPGDPYQVKSDYRNFSLMHTYTFSSNLLNQAQLGVHRTYGDSYNTQPFSFSSIGSSVPSFDSYPDIVSNTGFTIAGESGGGNSTIHAQTTYDLQDSISYLTGRHFLRFGGGLSRIYYNRTIISNGDFVVPSLQDLLLGACGGTGTCPGTGINGIPAIQGNGGTESNIVQSKDKAGNLAGDFRVWDFDAYVQDDFKATSRLTLNLGFRYDRQGYLSDSLGHNAGFNPNLITPYSNPLVSTPNCSLAPGTGSLLGYTVPSNFPGTIPAGCGVTQLNNSFGFNPDGRNNTWNPRVGFAWRLPHTEKVVVRGGYGIYHSITTGVLQENASQGPPFVIGRSLTAATNSAASLGVPFQPFTGTIPSFVPSLYNNNPGSASVDFYAPNFRPPMIQEYSLNVQTQLAKNLVLEVGYSGSRGLHLVDGNLINEACVVGASPSADGCPASFTNVTKNTAANTQLRVPYEGFTSVGLLEIQSNASFWYNALEASLTKRFSHGLQFQFSYTFDKELETYAGTGLGTTAIGTIPVNDFSHPPYGPDPFIRPQRFVASYVYDLPGPKDLHSLAGRVLGGWQWSGVTTYQAGQFLTITNASNGNNIYGDIAPGFVTASLVNGCSVGQLVNPGSLQSKLGLGPGSGTTSYFNTSCVTTPAVSPYASDGKGTGFGNLGAGVVRGPDQANWDMALGKHFDVPWPNQAANIEFRTDFFNAFNHTQFANPGLTYGTGSAFGQITSTSVNPRIIQLALRLNF